MTGARCKKLCKQQRKLRTHPMLQKIKAKAHACYGCCCCCLCPGCATNTLPIAAPHQRLNMPAVAILPKHLPTWIEPHNLLCTMNKPQTKPAMQLLMATPCFPHLTAKHSRKAICRRLSRHKQL